LLFKEHLLSTSANKSVKFAFLCAPPPPPAAGRELGVLQNIAYFFAEFYFIFLLDIRLDFRCELRLRTNESLQRTLEWQWQ
jgi:hypothetical protein